MFYYMSQKYVTNAKGLFLVFPVWTFTKELFVKVGGITFVSIVIKVPYKKSISNNTSEMLMEVRGILNVPSVERDSTANITWIHRSKAEIHIQT